MKELEGKLELKLNNTTGKLNAEITWKIRGHNLQQIKAIKLIVEVVKGIND